MRVALVTGGGRGIGRATALALGRAEHDVAVAARSVEELEAVVAELRGLGRRAAAIRCDVADPESVAGLVKRVNAELGPVEVLVNSAGVEASARLVDTSNEEWARILAVNLGGTFFASRAVLPAMLERKWGRIINIASTAARTGHKFTTAYCASKHGVLGLTRALAVEVATQGITVNAVCPGWVDTSMLDRAVGNIVEKTGRSVTDARDALASMNPQRRLVRPEEVAAMVVYVASDAAAPVTGQALGIDGGEVRA